MQSKLILFFSLVVLMTVSFVFSYCTSQDAVIRKEYEDFKKNTVILELNKKNIVPLSSIFSIELTSKPSSGYFWYVSSPENEYAKLIGYKNFDLSGKTEEAYVGGDIQTVWKWQPLKTGDFKIILKYYRQWEGEESAKETKEYHISITQ